MEKVRVRLVRKLAELIDGIDLSSRSVGDVFRLPADQARLLQAEGWAVPVGWPRSATRKRGRGYALLTLTSERP